MQFNRRCRVLKEFDVGEPSLVVLLEIRDNALESRSHIAATKVHELCLRVSANSDRKWAGGRKAVDEMTRAEMLAEIQEIKLKADGKGFDVSWGLRGMRRSGSRWG